MHKKIHTFIHSRGELLSVNPRRWQALQQRRNKTRFSQPRADEKGTPEWKEERSLAPLAPLWIPLQASITPFIFLGYNKTCVMAHTRRAEEKERRGAAAREVSLFGGGGNGHLGQGSTSRRFFPQRLKPKSKHELFYFHRFMSDLPCCQSTPSTSVADKVVLFPRKRWICGRFPARTTYTITLVSLFREKKRIRLI